MQLWEIPGQAAGGPVTFWNGRISFGEAAPLEISRAVKLREERLFQSIDHMWKRFFNVDASRTQAQEGKEL